MDKKKLGIIYHEPVGENFKTVINDCTDKFKAFHTRILEKYSYRIHRANYKCDDYTEFINNAGRIIDVINWSDIILIIAPNDQYKEENNSTWAYAQDMCNYANKEYYILYNSNACFYYLDELINEKIGNKTENKLAIPNFKLPKEENVLILGDYPASIESTEWYNYMIMDIDLLLTPLRYHVNSINIGSTIPQMPNIEVTMSKDRYVYYTMSKIKRADTIILLKPYTSSTPTDIWIYLTSSLKAFADKKIISTDFGSTFDSDAAVSEFNGNLLKALNDKSGMYNRKEYLEWTMGGAFNE